uniref:Uncharacterized protein n=1 Tax=Rhizophora mucronata TaxID=61149 RepID=A0A2P2MJC7_RHIMU
MQEPFAATDMTKPLAFVGGATKGKTFTDTVSMCGGIIVAVSYCMFYNSISLDNSVNVRRYHWP